MIAAKQNQYPPVERLKVPPHSIEAEQSVLGSILINQDTFDFIGDMIKPEDFYNRSHSIIFENIVEMVMKNRPIDTLTLSEHLERKSLLEDAGGFAYLFELSRNTPSSANCVSYAEIVVDKSLARKLIGASHFVSDVCYSPEGKQGKELILIAENQLTQIVEGVSTGKQDTSLSYAADKMLERLDINFKAGSMSGIPSGLIDLDKKTGGFQDSDLIIIAARPSMGKTTLALNFANHASKIGKRVMFFSLEMPKDQIVLKMCSEEKRIPITSLRQPGDKEFGMNDEQFTDLTNFIGSIAQDGRVLDIDDRGGLSPIDIKTALKRFVRKHGGVDMVVVDYLQIMKGSQQANRVLEITEISAGLKNIGKEFECPVIALSQLNRSLESRTNKRPVNSDLRDSGSIEQDADLILFVYRDEVYDEQTTDKGLAEIIIGKQRNGPLGTVGSVFLGQYSSFKNLSGQELTAALNKPAPKQKKYAKGLTL